MAMERAVLPSCWINRKEHAVKIIYITCFVSFIEQKTFSQEEHYVITLKFLPSSRNVTRYLSSKNKQTKTKKKFHKT